MQFLIQHNRRSGIRIVEDKLRGIVRHVDASVRSPVLVDLSAESGSPGRVMQPLPVVERHPVLDGRTVGLIGRNQRCRALLIGNRENPGLRRGSLRNTSGHDIRLQKKLIVLVEPQMLGAD